MKAEHIVDAMNDLSEDLIYDARPTLVRPRRKRLWRMALVAAALTLLLSVTAYAAGGSLAGLVTSTKRGQQWSTLEKLPQAEKLLGLPVAAPERFETGLVFENMMLAYSDRVDEQGQAVETFPELYLNYRDGARSVMLNIQRDRPQSYDGGWQAHEYKGVTLWCESFTYMAVPADYEPSEAELAAIERGELMIGYGSDRIESFSSSVVQFSLRGALYNLMSMDGVSLDELCSMAGELIEA